MANLYDYAYGLGLAVSSPAWLLRPKARQKVFRALSQRMGTNLQRRSTGQAILIHAVSLGEINATRGLVAQLRAQRENLNIFISATTDTGYARAIELYGNDPSLTVLRFPLDFTRAIERLLGEIRPSLVVLLELEVWPNFMRQCARRGVPVVVINGRVTEPSFRKYRLARLVTRGMFARLAGACVQDQANRQRFEALGVAPQRLHVTGTMKFDTATVARTIEGDRALADELGLKEGEALWVCGSTGPGEEALVLSTYRGLLKSFPDLRLAIVPRHPQRFDEVADLIVAAGFDLLRRSKRGQATPSPVILGDTMGELRKFYSLAAVVFVGRTLVDLGPRQHGSDMIEPAALAKPVIVGPFTTNFADAMARFREKAAMVEISSAAELQTKVSRLLSDPAHAGKLGELAQQVVIEQQGATNRHVDFIVEQLNRAAPPSASDRPSPSPSAGPA